MLKKRLENKADNAHPYLMHAILLIDEKNYSQAIEALQTASVKESEHQNSQLIRLLELGSYLLAEKYDELKLFLAANQKGNDMPAVFKLGPNEAAQKINLKIDFNEKTGMVDASLRLSGEYINSLKEKGIDLRVE